MYTSRAENGPVKKKEKKRKKKHLFHKDIAIQIMCTLIMTRHGKLL